MVKAEIIEIPVEDYKVDFDTHGLKERCRCMVVYEGKSLREVCEKEGLKRVQLKRWSDDEQWELQRVVVESGKEELLGEVLSKFQASKEMPLVSGYWGLQEEALHKLRELLGSAETASDVGLILEVAQRGLGIGEKVLSRGKMRDGQDINVGGGGKSVNVNILSALVSKGG